jgi:hypothetical protein
MAYSVPQHLDRQSYNNYIKLESLSRSFRYLNTTQIRKSSNTENAPTIKMQQRLNALSVERVENVLLPYVQQVNKLVLYAFPKKKNTVST